jgi:hypothetical protein
VILAAGDQAGNGGGAPASVPAAQLPQLRQVLVSIPALPASYLGGAAGNQVWISPNAAGSGAVPGGGQAQPATSPSASKAVSLSSTPPGPALRVLPSRVSDQAFVDLESTRSLTLAPTADPRWIW